MDLLTIKYYTILSTSSYDLPDEIDTPEYSSGTTYGISAPVKVSGSVTKLYYSLVAGNINNHPATNPDKWQYYRTSNKWAMFDANGGTVTYSENNPLTFTIRANYVDRMAFFGVEYAYSIRVVVTRTSTGDPIDDVTIILSREVYDYVVPFTYVADTVDISVTFAFSGGTYLSTIVFVGGCFPCLATHIGHGQYGADTGIIDFSKKITNDYGITYLAQGNYSKRASIDLEVLRDNVNAVYRTLVNARGKETIWHEADSGLEALLIYGFMRNFKIMLTDPAVSKCQLDIEGLS